MYFLAWPFQCRLILALLLAKSHSKLLKDLHLGLTELDHACAFGISVDFGGSQVSDANGLANCTDNSASLTIHMEDSVPKNWLNLNYTGSDDSQNAGLAPNRGHVILILQGRCLGDELPMLWQRYSGGQAPCIGFEMVDLNFVHDSLHTELAVEASCHLYYSFHAPSTP